MVPGAVKLFPRLGWLAAALSLSGCSFVFVEGPPADHETRATFGCSASYVSPILDTVYAGLQALAIATAQGAADDATAERLSSEEMAVQVGFGAVAVASAIYGFSTVGTCQQARAALTGRVMREQQALEAYRRAMLFRPPPPAPAPPTDAGTPEAQP